MTEAQGGSLQHHTGIAGVGAAHRVRVALAVLTQDAADIASGIGVPVASIARQAVSVGAVTCGTAHTTCKR
jgi:hypothetical protein